MTLLARIVLLPVGLGIAAASMVHAASEALPGALGSASMTTSLNGQALTEIADRGFGAEMAARTSEGQADLPRLSDSLLTLARNAFAVDPLEVSTIRTIAIGGVRHDDPERARQVMRLAAQLSKRDSVTDLWLAQDYAQAGDVGAMTASFDQALRTSVRARESAMTPLVNMLANEDSYAPLGELIERRPEWEADFWQTFVRNPIALQHSARFFEQTRLPIDRLTPDDRQRLYTNLKASAQYETLFSLARFDPAAKASPEHLAAGKFDTTGQGDPLGWTTHSEGDYAADVHAASGELRIDARSGSFGIAADRLFRLDRGYRLAIRMAEPVPANATVELAAVCGDGEGTRLARIVLAPGAQAGDGTVAAGACAFADLQLSFTVKPGRQDALLRVASISMSPS
jgi:hypothetical protein